MAVLYGSCVCCCGFYNFGFQFCTTGNTFVSGSKEEDYTAADPRKKKNKQNLPITKITKINNKLKLIKYKLARGLINRKEDKIEREIKSIYKISRESTIKTTKKEY